MVPGGWGSRSGSKQGGVDICRVFKSAAYSLWIQARCGGHLQGFQVCWPEPPPARLPARPGWGRDGLDLLHLCGRPGREDGADRRELFYGGGQMGYFMGLLGVTSDPPVKMKYYASPKGRESRPTKHASDHLKGRGRSYGGEGPHQSPPLRQSAKPCLRSRPTLPDPRHGGSLGQPRPIGVDLQRAAVDLKPLSSHFAGVLKALVNELWSIHWALSTDSPNTEEDLHNP